MPLMIPRPFRHPKAGMYYFRRVVPDNLRSLVGKREERRSHGTKDLEIAKRRQAEVWQEIETKWASLRAGSRTLTEREAHGIAAHFFNNWLARHRDNPSWQVLWHPELYDELWTAPGYDPESAGDTIPITDFFYSSMRRICFQQAEVVAREDGLRLDDWSQAKLAKAIGAALQRASLVLGGARGRRRAKKALLRSLSLPRDGS